MIDAPLQHPVGWKPNPERKWNIKLKSYLQCIQLHSFCSFCHHFLPFLSSTPFRTPHSPLHHFSTSLKQNSRSSHSGEHLVKRRELCFLLFQTDEHPIISLSRTGMSLTWHSMSSDSAYCPFPQAQCRCVTSEFVFSALERIVELSDDVSAKQPALCTTAIPCYFPLEWLSFHCSAQLHNI